MRRRHAASLALIVCMIASASCRAIFGIDDFGGGDGGETSGDASADGSSMSDGSLLDGASQDARADVIATDASGPGFPASNACPGCVLVGTVTLQNPVTGTSLALNDNLICWSDAVVTVSCVPRVGGTTITYALEGGVATEVNITSLALSPDALAVLSSNELFSFALSSGTTTSVDLHSTNVYGFTATPADQLVAFFAPDTPDAAAYGGVYGLAPASDNSIQVIGNISYGTATTIPDKNALYVATTSVPDGGYQMCKASGATFQCGAVTRTTQDIGAFGVSPDGSVAYSQYDEVHAPGGFITGDAGVNDARLVVLSQGEVYFAQGSPDGGAELAHWKPGTATFDIVAGSLGRAAYSTALVGDDRMVFFALYDGLTAQIIGIPR